MDTVINVVRKEIVKIEYVDKIKISLYSLKLGSCAEFNVSLVNENQEHFHYEMVKIDGVDYLNWLNDDTYVVDFILNHLELVKLV
jgi:hypothetical protein